MPIALPEGASITVGFLGNGTSEVDYGSTLDNWLPEDGLAVYVSDEIRTPDQMPKRATRRPAEQVYDTLAEMFNPEDIHRTADMLAQLQADREEGRHVYLVLARDDSSTDEAAEILLSADELEIPVLDLYGQLAHINPPDDTMGEAYDSDEERPATDEDIDAIAETVTRELVLNAQARVAATSVVLNVQLVLPAESVAILAKEVANVLTPGVSTRTTAADTPEPEPAKEDTGPAEEGTEADGGKTFKYARNKDGSSYRAVTGAGRPRTGETFIELSEEDVRRLIKEGKIKPEPANVASRGGRRK